METLTITKNKNNKEYTYNFNITYHSTLREDIDYNYIAEKLSELDIENTYSLYNKVMLYTNHDIENKLKEYFGDYLRYEIKQHDFKYAFNIKFTNDKPGETRLLPITKYKNNKTYEYYFSLCDHYNLRPDLDYDYIAEKLAELDIDGIRITPKLCRFYTDHDIENKLKEYFDCYISTTYTNGILKYAFELSFEEKIIQNL